MAERNGEPGPVVQRAIDALRELPPVREEAVARIVAAAARSRAQDTMPNEDDLLAAEYPVHRRWDTSARVAIGAAAIVVGALLTAAFWRAEHPVAQGPSTEPAIADATPANLTPGSMDAAPVPTQFVFDGRAHHVSLVGDFNNWDERATPLEREPGSRLWSVTVPIVRGRHIYAFLVDSVWTVDKRAPVARDPDFGVTGSVILVGRP